MKVSVAIATFNGEKYIQRQMESILAQTRLPDEIIISDDCSSDSTLVKLESLSYDAFTKIIVLENKDRIGFIKNFERAIRASTGDVIFICDQDDFWHPEKIEIMLAMQEKALLVHSDAFLVDKKGELLSGSYSRVSKKSPEFAPFARIIDDNCITGCTTMIARELIDLSPPFPAMMSHDQWLALLAADKQGVRYLPVALVYYRQHENNVIGSGLDRKSEALTYGGLMRIDREKHRAKAIYLRNILYRSQAVISEKNLKIMRDMAYYYEGLSDRGLGVRSMLIHMRYFRFINFKDPGHRRLIKLLTTPIRALFG